MWESRPRRIFSLIYELLGESHRSVNTGAEWGGAVEGEEIPTLRTSSRERGKEEGGGEGRAVVPARGVDSPPSPRGEGRDAVQGEEGKTSPEGLVGSEHTLRTELYQNPQQATTSPHLIWAGAVSLHPTLSHASRGGRSTILRPLVSTACDAQARPLPNGVKRVSENKERFDASQPGLKVGGPAGRPAGWRGFHPVE